MMAQSQLPPGPPTLFWNAREIVGALPLGTGDVYVQEQDDLRFPSEVGQDVVPPGSLWLPKDRTGDAMSVSLVPDVYALAQQLPARSKERKEVQDRIRAAEGVYRSLLRSLGKPESMEPNLATLLLRIEGEDPNFQGTRVIPGTGGASGSRLAGIASTRLKMLSRLGEALGMQLGPDTFESPWLGVRPFRENAAFVRRDLHAAISLCADREITVQQVAELRRIFGRLENSVKFILLAPQMAGLIHALGRQELSSFEEENRRAAVKLRDRVSSIDDTGFIRPVRANVLAEFEKVLSALESRPPGEAFRKATAALHRAFEYF